jgi:hypothetical protein
VQSRWLLVFMCITLEEGNKHFLYDWKLHVICGLSDVIVKVHYIDFSKACFVCDMTLEVLSVECENHVGSLEVQFWRDFFQTLVVS